MKDARAHLVRRRSEETLAGQLDESKGMAFWIFEGESRRAGFVFCNWAGLNLVRKKKFAHFGKVGSRKSNFGNKVIRRAAGDLLKFNALMAIYGVARVSYAKARGRCGIEAEDFGIESARGVEVCGEKANRCDSSDFRTRRGLGRNKRINTEGTQEESTESTEKITRDPSTPWPHARKTCVIKSGATPVEMASFGQGTTTKVESHGLG
jgi:hypothetical protein